MSLITLQHVYYTINGISILKDISLTINWGKITTIIGPNGAGKTSLLRLMLGLSTPTKGEIHRSVKTIGYMPQKLHLNPLMPLTVHRFLQLTLTEKNNLLQDKIKSVLHEVGACHLENRMMRVLSGGELQRIMLARALLLDPQLLILDEPAQGVDVMGQAHLYALISAIRDRRRCGIVLVSHDLHLVMAASDEVICLNQHVCCSGTPHLVQQNPEYQALFALPEAYPPQMAFYPHHHDHHHGDTSCEADHDHPPKKGLNP